MVFPSPPQTLLLGVPGPVMRARSGEVPLPGTAQVPTYLGARCLLKAGLWEPPGLTIHTGQGFGVCPCSALPPASLRSCLCPGSRPPAPSQHKSSARELSPAGAAEPSGTCWEWLPAALYTLPRTNLGLRRRPSPGELGPLARRPRLVADCASDSAVEPQLSAVRTLYPGLCMPPARPQHCHQSDGHWLN